MSAPIEPVAKSPAAPRRRGRQRARSEEGFAREERLLRRREYLRVQQQGRRVHTAHFIWLLLQARVPVRVPVRVNEGASVPCDRDTGPRARLGITVGRRVGGAVQRNRIKRLVREVFRRNRALFPRDCDTVLVARPGAEGLDYGSVLEELTRAQAAIERIRRQWAAESEPSSEP
jgi:ribonuclease P protein component